MIMKIWSEDSIRNFNFWSGGRDTVDDLYDFLLENYSNKNGENKYNS